LSGSPLTSAPAREQVLEAAAEGLRKVADLLHLLAATEERPGPRLVSGREPEELLRVGEAAAVLKISRRSVTRLARRFPRVIRRVGRVVRYERGELLRACRQGG
jgi:hypothetical protein